MNTLNTKIIQCEKSLEIHPKGIINNREAGQMYTDLKTMGEELGCGKCLDMRKCEFANHLMNIVG